MFLGEHCLGERRYLQQKVTIEFQIGCYTEQKLSVNTVQAPAGWATNCFAGTVWSGFGSGPSTALRDRFGSLLVAFCSRHASLDLASLVIHASVKTLAPLPSSLLTTRTASRARRSRVGITAGRTAKRTAPYKSTVIETAETFSTHCFHSSSARGRRMTNDPPQF